GRRIGNAMATASRERVGVSGGGARDGPATRGAGGLPVAAALGGFGAGEYRRSESSRGVVAAVQYRDRGRTWTAQGQDLANRTDGRRIAPRKRNAGSERAR